jgi:hypothetical protein
MLPAKRGYPNISNAAQDWLIGSYQAMKGVRTITTMPEAHFKELKKAGLVSGTPLRVQFTDEGWRCIAHFKSDVDYRAKNREITRKTNQQQKPRKKR